MQHSRSIFAMLFYFRFLCIVLLCPNFCIILLLIVSFLPMLLIDCCSFLCLAPLMFSILKISRTLLYGAYPPPLCPKHCDKTLLNPFRYGLASPAAPREMPRPLPAFPPIDADKKVDCCEHSRSEGDAICVRQSGHQ